MKLFFELPCSGSERIPGLKREWEALLSTLADTGGEHSITDNRQLADAIIHTAAAQLDESTVRALLKPLSADDVCQLVWDWEDKPTGRMSGFYCSLQGGLHDPRRHRSLSYPIAFNELVDEFAQDDATVDFGFVGGISAGVRERLMAVYQPAEREDNSIIRYQPAVWSEACSRDGNASKADYAEFMRRTRFILCPRGYGVGTARFFETLKAGRVPILISDGYVLPAGIDWQSCAIRIPEAKIGSIREVVKTSMDRWASMARSARAVWEQNFAAQSLLPCLASNIIQMRRAIPDIGVGYRMSYSARIAGALITHHWRPALGHLKKAVTDGLVRAH